MLGNKSFDGFQVSPPDVSENIEIVDDDDA